MHYEHQPNGLMSVRDGCFNRMGVAAFPAELQLILVMRLAGQPEDFAEEAAREIRVHLLGVDMGELLDLKFESPVAVEVPADHPAGWEVALTLPIVVKFEVVAEGGHSFDFYVNGKYQTGRSVAVWVAEGPPATPQAQPE